MPVNTALGPIETTDLGPTLFHEHVSLGDWSMRTAFGDRFYQHQLVADRATEHFARAGECGVRTVVDGTPANMGRDVRLVKEVAERTGLNFVVSSGFHYLEELYLTYRSEGEIHELLSRECEDGIAGTGILPGMMKAACEDAGLTPLLDKTFRAIGTVAAEQHLPLFAHHHPETANGEAIIDLLEDCDVVPQQVVLGHSGDSNDLDYLERLLGRGVYLGMDRFGYCDVSNSLANRVSTIVELCARGHADRLLLSHDLATFIGVFGSWSDYEQRDPLAQDVDYTFIHTTVLPALAAAGVDAAQAAAMLERNVANLFENALAAKR